MKKIELIYENYAKVGFLFISFEGEFITFTGLLLAPTDEEARKILDEMKDIHQFENGNYYSDSLSAHMHYLNLGN